MSNITFKIQGLEEFAKSDLKISNAVAQSIGKAGRLLHSELRSAITRNYMHSDSLDSVLENRTSSTTKFGKGIISSGLIYNQVYKDLSKFSYSYYWGNLNKPKTRQGYVHLVTITRRNTRKSYGKYGRGGFVPKYKDGSAVRFGKSGAVMLERISKKKYPLRRLIGPSLANLAAHVYETDSVVKNIKNNIIPEMILESLLDAGI